MAFASCSLSAGLAENVAESALIGTWQFVGGGEVMGYGFRLNADGTGEFLDTDAIGMGTPKHLRPTGNAFAWHVEGDVFSLTMDGIIHTHSVTWYSHWFLGQLGQNWSDAAAENLYDRTDELEEAIANVTRKMNGAYGEKINAETLCKILLKYDRMYGQMSDAEKKQFFQNFVKSIEIDPNPASKNRVLKHIEFRFPVSYDAEDGQVLLRTENDVETVFLLSKIKAALHI